MGLIIKNEIQKLMVGYPTVSDKYDVQGGVLEGAADGHFGELVVFGSAQGAYKVPTSAITAVGDVAGFLVAQNVKLATAWPATDASVAFKAGEGINLLLKGYIAVELDGGATVANIKEGAKVAVFLAAAGKIGKLTTSGTANAIDLPGVYFTGIYENHGTAAAPKYVAEIVVK